MTHRLRQSKAGYPASSWHPPGVRGQDLDQKVLGIFFFFYDFNLMRFL